MERNNIVTAPQIGSFDEFVEFLKSSGLAHGRDAYELMTSPSETRERLCRLLDMRIYQAGIVSAPIYEGAK